MSPWQKPSNFFVLLCILLLFTLISCGKNEEKSEVREAVDIKPVRVFGSFGSNLGQVSPYYANLLLLINNPSKKVFFSKIDEQGNFNLTNVPAGLGMKYAVILVNHNYSFKAIMTFSRPSKKVAEYIQISEDTNLGNIRAQGPILISSEYQHLTLFNNYEFFDDDSDQIPNGLDRDNLSDRYITKKNKNGDLDGKNEVDQFDFDDDNDGLPDILDPDNDDDMRFDHMDTNDRSGDPNGGELDRDVVYGDSLYANDPSMVYFTAYYQKRPVSTQRDKYLFIVSILARIKEPPAGSTKTIQSLSVQTPRSYQDTLDFQGNPWDNLLYDDGKHGDSNAQDLIWGAQVKLKEGQEVAFNDMLILTVNFSNGERENYIYVFNKVFQYPVSIREIDASTQEPIIRWEGDPLPTQAAGYKFQVLTYLTETGEHIYSSPLLDGALKEFVIPYGILSASTAYDVVVRAVGEPNIQGFEADSIYSVGQEFNTLNFQ